MAGAGKGCGHSVKLVLYLSFTFCVHQSMWWTEWDSGRLWRCECVHSTSANTTGFNSRATMWGQCLECAMHIEYNHPSWLYCVCVCARRLCVSGALQLMSV